MNTRARTFCAIAGKFVTTSLRHGTVPHEPRQLYVRCDERDCQYVDLNQPPCPLTPAMFDDGSGARVAAFLRTNAGARFCYSCLTDALGISHEQVRRASWGLREEPGTSIRPARCHACEHRGVTIRIAGASDGAPQQESLGEAALLPGLSAYLRRHGRLAFCARCLARELTRPLTAVRRAMRALKWEPTFSLESGRCGLCLLAKAVIRCEAAPPEDAAPRRVMDLLIRVQGDALCATCVAYSTDLSLLDTQRLIGHLGALPDFERSEGLCDGCGRPTARIAKAVRALRDVAE